MNASSTELNWLNRRVAARCVLPVGSCEDAPNCRPLSSHLHKTAADSDGAEVAVLLASALATPILLRLGVTMQGFGEHFHHKHRVKRCIPAPLHILHQVLATSEIESCRSHQGGELPMHTWARTNAVEEVGICAVHHTVLVFAVCHCPVSITCLLHYTTTCSITWTLGC